MAKSELKKSARAPRRSGSSPKLAALDQFRVSADGEHLTTDQGVRINDDQNSLKAGARGPTLLEDFHPPREDHPLRSRAHSRARRPRARRGRPRLLPGLPVAGSRYTQGQVPPGSVGRGRRSSCASRRWPGRAGSSDLARDVRGFAVKFYTEEGNFDLVGNNIPVFFIQDAIKFPDLIHAVKPEPHNEMPQAASAHDTFWDFISLMPESMHMIMWVMSDRAIPAQLPHDGGLRRPHVPPGQRSAASRSSSSSTGSRSSASIRSSGTRRRRSPGKDPDFHRRDLWEAIESGAFPEWELGLQIIEEKDEHAFDFDLLDPTKIVPEELVPVQRVGQDDARPQPRQLLRRDGAGRLPPRPHRARHRLHE